MTLACKRTWQGAALTGVTYSCMGLVHPDSQPILNMLYRQILPYALQLLACVLVICVLAQTEQVSIVKSA